MSALSEPTQANGRNAISPTSMELSYENSDFDNSTFIELGTSSGVTPPAALGAGFSDALHPDEVEPEPDMARWIEQVVWVRSERVSADTNRYRMWEQIKQLPTSFAIKRQLRYRLVAVHDSLGWQTWSSRTYRCRIRLHKFWGNLPFRRIDLPFSQKLSSMYGSSLQLYTTIVRQFLGLNLLISLALLLFLILPQAAINPTGSVRASNCTDFSNSCLKWAAAGLCNSDSLASHTRDICPRACFICRERSDSCSMRYKFEANAFSTPAFVDFLQGTGGFEYSVAFIGFYTNTLSKTSDSSYNIPFLALFLPAVFFCVCLVTLLCGNGTAFGSSLHQALSRCESAWFGRIFAAWEHKISAPGKVPSQQKCLKKFFLKCIAEEQLIENGHHSKRAELLKFHLRRIAINLLFLCLVLLSGFFLYHLVKLTYQPVNSRVGVPHRFLLSYLPPICLYVFISVVFWLFGRVTSTEALSSDTAPKLNFLRRILLQLFGLLAIVSSVLFHQSCSVRDECHSSITPCPFIRCWETAVGQQIWRLAVMDCVVHVLRLINSLLWRYLRKWGRERIRSARFDIYEQTAMVIHTQTICWFGVFFCPVVPFFVFIILLLSYCMRMIILLNVKAKMAHYVRPSSLRSFIVTTLVAVIAICFLFVSFAISRIRPSLSCGPFRGTDSAADSVWMSIERLPNGLRQTLMFVASPGFLAVLLCLLLTLTYFLYSSVRVYRSVTDDVDQMLFAERRQTRQLEKYIRTGSAHSANDGAGGSRFDDLQRITETDSNRDSSAVVGIHHQPAPVRTPQQEKSGGDIEATSPVEPDSPYYSKISEPDEGTVPPPVNSADTVKTTDPSSDQGQD